jgi:hypothetical protein
VLRTNPPGAAGLLLSAVSASHVKQPSRAGPPPPATAVGAVGAGNHRIRGARANSPLSPSPPFLQSLSAPQPVPLPRSRPGSPLPTHPPACHPHFLFYRAQHTSRRLKYSGATTTTGGRVLEEDPRPTSAIKAPRAPVTGLAPPPF